MKKAAVLLAAMYLYLLVPLAVVFAISGKDDEYSGLPLLVLIICLILLLIIGVFNMVSAVELYKAGDYNKLRSEMQILKLGSIPFFLAEYVILIISAMGFTVLAIFFIWTIAGPIVIMILLTLIVIVSYTVMLISSVYGIAFISLLRKERRITTGLSILYILFQLIPIADIIVTIVIVSKYKKEQ